MYAISPVNKLLFVPKVWRPGQPTVGCGRSDIDERSSPPNVMTPPAIEPEGNLSFICN